MANKIVYMRPGETLEIRHLTHEDFARNAKGWQDQARPERDLIKINGPHSITPARPDLMVKHWKSWSAAPQPPAEEGWKPMESAPKDGTVIDLWHEEWGRHPDCYWGKPQHCCGEADRYCDSDWHGAPEGWVDSALNSFVDEFIFDHFTHWMPLPPAPANGGEQNGT